MNFRRLASGVLHFASLVTLILLVIGGLSACTGSDQPTTTPTRSADATGQATSPPTQKPAQPGAKATLYVPPTAAPDVTLAVVQPSPSLSPTALTQPFSPTVTPTCIDDLKFLEDLSIPDGTKVAPGEQLDKRWQVQNSGTCNWDELYTLRLVDGLSLGAPEVQALFPARSGAQALIRMFFTAPSEPGSYQSAWKAFDPQGMEFGEAIFIQIVVK